MKVLFVCSGNSKNGVSTIVEKQAESLIKVGCNVDILPIKERGIFGYIKYIPIIRKKAKNGAYDLIHAHFVLSAFAVTMSLSRIPIIVSLMGSDVFLHKKIKPIIKFLCYFIWDAVIVKSEEMQSYLKYKNAVVLPNGVDLSLFKPIKKEFAVKEIGFKNDKKNIIFFADPLRKEKNFKLAKHAYDLLNDKNIILQVIYNKNISDIPFYLNAADVLLLTSLHEGSPNVIKEAMACNLPIVSVDVGDVKTIISDIEGCYISKNNPIDLCENLKKALQTRRTEGRKRIIELGLDSKEIAHKLNHIYIRVVSNRELKK